MAFLLVLLLLGIRIRFLGTLVKFELTLCGQLLLFNRSNEEDKLVAHLMTLIDHHNFN